MRDKKEDERTWAGPAVHGCAVNGFRIKAGCLFQEEEDFRNPRGQRRGGVDRDPRADSAAGRREGAAASRTRPESGGAGLAPPRR